MQYDAKLTGKLIFEERTKRKMTQQKLGDLIHVSGKQISNYEHGNLIPPIDVLMQICTIFECELGYLLGETQYSDGTHLQTAIREHLGLTPCSSTIIRKITGTDHTSLSFGYQSEKYSRVLNTLLSSPSFPYFIEALADLDDCVRKQKQVFDDIEEKYGKDLLDEAIKYETGQFDFEHDLNAEQLRPELCDAIRELRNAIDQSYELSYPIKVARYELNESFESMIRNIYPQN